MGTKQEWAKQLLDNATTANVEFYFPGGVCSLSAKATWGGGSLKLQQLLPDNVTWVDIANSTLSADGYLNVTIPPGKFRSVLATATAVYARVTRIP